MLQNTIMKLINVVCLIAKVTTITVYSRSDVDRRLENSKSSSSSSTSLEMAHAETYEVEPQLIHPSEVVVKDHLIVSDNFMAAQSCLSLSMCLHCYLCNFGVLAICIMLVYWPFV